MGINLYRSIAIANDRQLSEHCGKSSADLQGLHSEGRSAMAYSLLHLEHLHPRLRYHHLSADGRQGPEHGGAHLRLLSNGARLGDPALDLEHRPWLLYL